jgi:hypothetical protein
LDRITAYSLSLRHPAVFGIMEPFIMDTRAFSMARSLRRYAGAGALVLCSICGPALAQQQDDDLVTIPFSALSAAAQAEILALQGVPPVVVATNPLDFPFDMPVAQGVSDPVQTQTVMVDGRRVRINWAVGMYR